jgi:hypothetical protein
MIRVIIIEHHPRCRKPKNCRLLYHLCQGLPGKAHEISLVSSIFYAGTYSGTQLMRTGKLVSVRTCACASGLYVFDLEAKTEPESLGYHVYRKERKLLLLR